VRAFSTSFLKASRRADYAANLRRDWGDGGFLARAGVNTSIFGPYDPHQAPLRLAPRPREQALPRDQQGRSPHCRGSDPGAPLYRAAHRALTSLAPDCEAKPVVTISEIENVLSDEAGCKRSPCTHLRRTVAWIAIRELGDLGCCKQLAGATEEQRAAVLFCRVHGIGREYAKKL
jgi:hypothetical protein